MTLQTTLRYTYRGLIVPVFTPFMTNSERSLNANLVPRYSDYLRSKNLHGVLINGTTGEGMTMTANERKELAEAWSESARRNEQHLVIQVGGGPLTEVKDLAKHAQSLKADAILCLPELYYKPSNREELIEYLAEVAEAASDTPLLYYHFPGMTNVQIHMGQFLENLAERLPSLVGIKFTSTNLEEGLRALRASDGRYVIFLGSNEIMPAGSAAGIDSFMASCSNLFPELVRGIVQYSKEADYTTAKSKQEKLLRAFYGLSQLGHPVSSMKAAMSLLSPVEVGPSRKPLPSFDNECDQRKLRNLFKLWN